eukprot:202933_1
MSLQAICKGKRIMSGIQPTGEAHIGNYLGAIRNWVNLSKQIENKNKKIILSIVDLHALTIPTAFKPSTLNTNCFKMATTIIGCGMDIENTLLYYQSSVHQHSELMWLLSCHSSIGYLQRMPQYNEKKNKDGNIGILTYPVLQSSDILLFDTDIVPVGQDQLIHINFTRDLVDRINSFYDKNVFVKPEVYINDTGNDLCSKVMSLRNADNKMSKSEASHMSRIDLTDSMDDIIRKIKKSVTDSEGLYLTYDEEKRKGLANLIRIYTVIKQEMDEDDGITVNDIVKQFENESTEYFKGECGELLACYLKPIREEILRLRKEKKYINQLLKKNAVEAQEIAQQTVYRAKKAFGLPC